MLAKKHRTNPHSPLLPTVLRRKVLGYLTPKDILWWRHVCRCTQSDCGELETIRIGCKHTESSFCIPAAVRQIRFTDRDGAKVASEIDRAAVQFHHVRKVTFKFRMPIATFKRLAAFQSLQELDIDTSAVVFKTDLDFLTTLQHLRKLNLDGCFAVTRGAVEQIAAIHSLESLRLLECGVSDGHLQPVPRLANLTDLNLGINNVNDAGVVHLTSLTNLRNLILSYNLFGDQGCLWLARMPTLRRLSICYCAAVGDAGAAAIATLIGLTSLDISGCVGVSAAGIAQLAALVNLTELNLLDLDHVDDAVLAAFAPLSQLTDLKMNCCESVTDAGVAHIVSSMPAMENLRLDCCIVSHAAVLLLATLANLRTLSLENCKLVTDESVAVLANVTSLRFVNVLKCPLLTAASFDTFPKHVLCLMNSFVL